MKDCNGDKEATIDVWKDFRDNFPDIGFDENMCGYPLMRKVKEWSKGWPDNVWIQKVGDALATSSYLVFISHDHFHRSELELVVIPQNANKPTLITISRPAQTMAILGRAMRLEDI